VHVSFEAIHRHLRAPQVRLTFHGRAAADGRSRTASLCGEVPARRSVSTMRFERAR
jgi:hypothetical protein